MANREAFLVIALAALLGCRTHVKVEPVEVKPITMTININIKVDRQLDDFFDFEETMKPEKNDQGGEQ